MIESLLLEHIKKLLLSDPLDIYSDEEETVSQSSYELVESRELTTTVIVDAESFEYDLQQSEEADFSRVIGSANLFIAASIVCDEVTHGKALSKLNEEELLLFQETWREVINLLLGERFMRETQQTAHSKIKLVVNNRELPNVGVQ
jgi:hypothetical protein